MTGSLGMEFEFLRGFDFSFLTTFSIGGKIYDSMYNTILHPGYNKAISTKVLERWQKPGDITEVPALDITNAPTHTNDRSLVNASYLSIKSITLGYTFPKAVLGRVGVSKMRVFASLDNYFLFTHLKGMNPQYSFGGTTNYVIAPQKTMALGLNLTF